MKKQVSLEIIKTLKRNCIEQIITKYPKETLEKIGLSGSKVSHIKNTNRRDIATIEILAKLKMLHPEFDMNLIFDFQKKPDKNDE